MESVSLTAASLTELFPEKRLTFCSCRELGLLVFDGNAVHLVSVLNPRNTSDLPKYTKIATIRFNYSLPNASDVCKLSLSENSRFLILASPQCVYVVELHKDFWKCQSIIKSARFESFRRIYNIDFTVLNTNLQLAKKSLGIKKISWLTSYSTTEPISVLGVLYSDNVIRVYNLVASKSSPVALVDFKRTLPENATSESESGYGVANSINSFDFGHQISKSSLLFTLLALDTDGSLYWATFGLTSETESQIFGPLKLTGINDSDLSALSNFEDVLFIGHNFSKVIPFFSLCTDDGTLVHAVVCNNDDSSDSYDAPIKLVVLDVMVIEDWHPTNVTVNLMRDLNEPCRYYVINETEIILVDATPQITEFINSAASSLAPSSIRRLFKSITAYAKCYITDAAFLILEKEEGCSPCVTLMAVLDSHNSFASFFIHEAYKSYERARANVDKHGKRPYRGIGLTRLPPLPKLVVKDDPNSENVEAVADYARKLAQHANLQSENVIRVQALAQNVSDRALNIIKKKNDAYDKLLAVYIESKKVREKLIGLKKNIRGLDDRFMRIVDAIEAKSYDPEDDDRCKDSLKKIRTDAKNYVMELAVATNRIVKERARLCGPTKSFQASVSAQKFMLTKNTSEITEAQVQAAKLRKEATKLSKS